MSYQRILATIARQWIVVTVVLIVGLIAFVVLWPHFRKYTATSTMLAATSPASASGTLDPSKDPISNAVGLNDLQVLATSEVILSRVAASLHLSEGQTEKLPSEVKAKALFDSDVLPIAVTDADPQVAIDASNGIARELSSYSQRIATGRYDELIANLEAQIKSQRAQLEKIDTGIQGVSSDDFYITPEAGTSAIDTRLIALQQQQEQLEVQVDGDQAAETITAQQPELAHSLARHEILKDDVSVQTQRLQLGKDIAAMNLGLSGYSLAFPGLKGYTQQVHREAAEVRSNEDVAAHDPGESESYVAALIQTNKAKAALATDSAQLARVRSQLDDLRGHLSGSAATQGSQVAQLRRSRAAGEDVLTDLSQRLAKARADRAQADSIGSVVIVDHAIDASPALLGRPLVLGAGLAVIFIWLAITLAFIVDGADDRLHSPEAMEKLYGRAAFTPVG